jgi:nicotinamidase-related amidase
MNPKHIPFTPANAAIILVDHQPGVLAMAGSVPKPVVTANAAMLARLGDQLGIPLVITSTRENLDFLGTTLKEIQTAAPTAYGQRVRRAGTLNAFADPAFTAAVAATKRRHLVIAGILTDVCLFHSVVSALEAGYQVQVVADACGTSTTLADTVTYDRLRSLGAVITTAYGILFELFPDLSTPEGQKAEGVAVASAAQMSTAA